MPIRDKAYLPPPGPMKTVKRADNSIVLSTAEPLQEFDPNILHSFFANVLKHPDKTLYAQRRQEPDGQTGDWGGAQATLFRSQM